MILVVSVENMDTIFGVYEENKLINTWRIKTDTERSSDELYVLFKMLLSEYEIKIKDISGVIISSVVPDMTYSIEKMFKIHFNLNPKIVGVGVKTGLNIRTENPKEVGSDRIVNCVGAIEKYETPIIILNMSSVITFDVIDKNKNYIGGLIVPGIKLAREALSKESAKLPRVEIIKPKSIIGKNTTSSIQSGLYYQYTSMIDGIIFKILEDLKINENEINILSTGSFCSLLIPESRYKINIDSDLTFRGLKLIYELNKEDSI